MDLNTNVTAYQAIEFPDEGTRATGGVANVHEGERRRPAPTDIAESKRSEPVNTLPEVIQASWSRIAHANMSVHMFSALVRIATQPPGWRGPGSLALRSASLKNFLEFWSAVRDNASEPELGLAPDGSLHAEWFRSARQRLDVRFLDQKVIFGLFAGNSILEGAEPRDTAAQILNAHHAKPLSWSAG
jgi:hypothetical protein